MAESIKIGVTYQDSITGLKGVSTGIAKWIDGTASALIQPPLNKNGEVPESRWIEKGRLEEID